MLRRALGGLVVFVVVLLGAPRARAQVKGAPRLEFSAPPGCPNEATFRNNVAIFFGGQDPFNPTAPDVVLVGDRPHVIRDAKLFATQQYPVPVFIKQATNQWEYVGNYVVERYSTDPVELQQLRSKAKRPHAVGALFLKKIE